MKLSTCSHKKIKGDVLKLKKNKVGDIFKVDSEAEYLVSIRCNPGEGDGGWGGGIYSADGGGEPGVAGQSEVRWREYVSGCAPFILFLDTSHSCLFSFLIFLFSTSWPLVVVCLLRAQDGQPCLLVAHAGVFK